MTQNGESIFLGILFGFLARVYMLRSDYRQYPGYPHGFVTHLSLGFIAAALGSVALPALVAKDYAAVTFLALAATQFREIRGMERQSLAAVDEIELVPRGSDFIEGIARVFEARNYLVMVTALIISSVNYFTHWPQLSIVVGIVAIFSTGLFMKGKTIGMIATVQPAKVTFDGPILMVGDVGIMNVGLPSLREKISKEALGVTIHPKDDNARSTLHSMGQRQAIVNVVTTVLGTKKDIDTPEFTPMARKQVDKGYIALYCMPAEPDMEALIQAIKRVPALESASRAPLKTKAGKMAED